MKIEVVKDKMKRKNIKIEVVKDKNEEKEYKDRGSKT